LALFVITFFQPGGPWGIWTLRILWAGSIAWFLLAPAWEGLQVAARVRDGLVGTADVRASRTLVGRYRIRRVEGRRIVHHPLLGDFPEEFSIAAPWMDAVASGSTMDVLMAPEERQTWLTLGLHSDARSTLGVG
jgi:hypothetical protein